MKAFRPEWLLGLALAGAVLAAVLIKPDPETSLRAEPAPPEQLPASAVEAVGEPSDETSYGDEAPCDETHGCDPHAADMKADPSSCGHAQESAPAVTVKAGDVQPAEGPSGRTIAALVEQRQALAGKVVRVRGVVTKVVSGVLDTNFVHLSDGSGGDDDLTVSMATPPEVGQTVLIEGTVVVNHDVGAGYVYSVFLQNARSVGAVSAQTSPAL